MRALQVVGIAGIGVPERSPAGETSRQLGLCAFLGWLIEPRSPKPLRQIRRGNEAIGRIVGVAIATSVAELSRQRRRRVAQVQRHRERAMGEGRRRRALDAEIGGVALGRAGQEGHGLRQRDAAFRQADALDGEKGRGGETERRWFGVADVLGGEDDEPPGHEERVVAGLEQARQVVERGVRIAGAQALDQCGDDVVVLLAVAIVEQHAAPRGLLHRLRRQRLGASRMERGGRLQQTQRAARVAVRHGDDGTQGVGREAHARASETPLRVLGRPRHEGAQGVFAERPQREDATAREQGAVHLEGRILRRGSDQREPSRLDVGQQRVLLGAIEAVDLVQEEDGSSSRGRLVPGALRHLADVLHAYGDGRKGQEARRRRRPGGHEQTCDRGLAAARRPPEHERRELLRLGQGAQRRARRQQVLLAQHLGERPWAHARGQRGRRLGARRGGGLEGLGACRRGRPEEVERLAAGHAVRLAPHVPPRAQRAPGRSARARTAHATVGVATPRRRT